MRDEARFRITITVEDSTNEYVTNTLSTFRAEQALGRSIIGALGRGPEDEPEFAALAAMAYSVSAAAEPEFLKAHGGSHRTAFEAWLAMDPTFNVGRYSVPKAATPSES